MNAPAALEEVIPRLRGVLHAYAFWIAGVAAVLLIALSPSAEARLREFRDVVAFIETELPRVIERFLAERTPSPAVDATRGQAPQALPAASR